MSLNASEQELFEFGQQAIPQVFRSHDRIMEELRGLAKMAGKTKEKLSHWLTMAKIGTATGSSGSLNVAFQASAFQGNSAQGTEIADCDWLDLHATDRGTRRAFGEGDASLRYRLIHAPDSVNRESILDAAQNIISIDNTPGRVEMVELPRDGMFIGSVNVIDGDSVSGGTFVGPDSAGVMTFTPVDTFIRTPYVNGLSGFTKRTEINIAYASESGNNGTFRITGLTENACTYVNASGVAGVDASADWTVSRFDSNDVNFEGAESFYLDRGYRVGSRIPSIILILPFGSTASAVASIKAMLIQKKAAGVLASVEVRTE